MPDTFTEARDLADELEDAGYDVVDTLAGHAGSPSEVILEIEDLEIEGETFDEAELILQVSNRGVSAGAVSVYDEPDHRLTEDQTAVLDEVCDDKYSEEDLTLWDYEPDGYEDSVDTFVEDARETYRDLD